MSQRTIGDIEIVVVCMSRVEVASTTFVDCVKDMRPNTTSKDGNFVGHIDIVIIFCKLN